MLSNIVKANLSKKLISALVSILVVSLNQKFGLNLSENTVDLILGLSLAHISLQTIIDSIKAYVSHKYIQPATTVISSGTSNIKWDASTYREARPLLLMVQNGINDLLEDAKKEELLKDTMPIFAELHNILESVKKVEPLAAVAEVTERQESA